MTVALKQWKTNISHGDKRWLRSITTSLPLPFCLCECLSRSVSTSVFQFLRCQSLQSVTFSHLESFKQHGRFEQVGALRCRIKVMCRKDRLKLTHTHQLSWTNGIASLQAELCLSAVVKGMRLHLNVYEVFLGSRGEQPLMILSWLYPRRADKCWGLLIDTSDWWAFSASWILRCHARILQMKAPTKPTH